MILDHLHNKNAYTSLHPLFAKTFSYLEKLKESDFEKSKEEIDGENCFALFYKGDGKNPAKVILEAHRKFIDVQYIFKGSDKMAFKPLNECGTINTEYNEKDDYILFNDEAKSNF